MPSLADSLVSSAARKLSIRKRSDLSARRQRYQGRVYWVVKEPIGLNYFRFQEEEFAILQMLDGQVSLDEIKEQFEAEFPPQKITVEEIQQFLGTLHRSGLVVIDVPGQGRQLHERRDERKRKEFFATMSNVLAIRFKGIDPDRLLNRLLPWTSWFFSKYAVITFLTLGAIAVMLITVKFDVFQSRLPSFHQFFTVSNFFYMSITLGLTKVLHEFGHGLTCKRFGGECHEMGVMILVLTPCLYCNVSDSWMLPNKWHRAAIGAAGMYVEVVIATFATYIWWFTQPGMLNHLCLSIMFVCSVSTILFNGNPLLRYDGYYILMDIVEIPNLRQKSSAILSNKLGKWCLGLDPPDDPFLPERNQIFFAMYTVAAAAYRWFVVLSIVMFLHKVFEPYRLEIIGQIIAMSALYGLLVQPLWKLGKFMYVPGRLAKVKKLNLMIATAVVAAFFAAIAFIPLPYRVLCTFEVQPRDAIAVYVDVNGVLKEVHVQPGDEVKEGTLLAVLSNVDIQLSLAQLEAEQAQNEEELRSLKYQENTDPSASDRITTVLRSIEGVKKQIDQSQRELDNLTLLANADGTVLPPPEVSESPAGEGQLPTWSGIPMNPRNLGCLLTENTLFCQLGDPRKMEAILVIDQSDMEMVEEGQRATLLLDELPFDPFESEITDISRMSLQFSPRSLSNKAGGELATETDASGRERPQRPSYQARANLDGPPGLLRQGLRGRAKIYVKPRTLGQRIWRYAAQTFNFEL